MSEEMFEEGYQKITNIDISKVVIDDMRANTKIKSVGYSCFFKCDFETDSFVDLTMDACNMHSIKDGYFQAAIDKATMDSLLVNYLWR